MVDQDIRRGNRKRRQWGLHGRDRITWSVNQSFREIEAHYYYRDWNYFTDARQKWEAISERRRYKPGARS